MTCDEAAELIYWFSETKPSNEAPMVEAEKPDELRHFLDCRMHAREILKSNGREMKER